VLECRLLCVYIYGRAGEEDCRRLVCLLLLMPVPYVCTKAATLTPFLSQSYGCCSLVDQLVVSHKSKRAERRMCMLWVSCEADAPRQIRLIDANGDICSDMGCSWTRVEGMMSIPRFDGECGLFPEMMQEVVEGRVECVHTH
jgi:hypothetical protein